jgi:hypothetical protein
MWTLIIWTSIKKLIEKLKAPSLRPYLIASALAVLIILIWSFGSCKPEPPPTTYDLKGTQDAVERIEDRSTDRMEEKFRIIDERRDGVDARLKPFKKKNVTAEELEEKTR